MQKADAEYDAGPTGCGQLLIDLRMKLKEMPPGAVLKIKAYDSGVPEDLPAWCRLTGHTLLEAAHPDYWIERRKEQ
ncbi:MAG TPA: sulfurtransferase TusA family protein [Planctomycetota bacterium]|nr:sulfurtransferase TusA family protein [Planctomycetota bacterium]